jgi:P4 family phage/plasmid primase-like protien
VIKWQVYMDDLPTLGDVASWMQQYSGCWIGVACGRGSGNLELLEFDVPGKHELKPGEQGVPPAYEPWRELVAQCPGGGELLAKLVIEQSPSGGMHVFYRAAGDVPGNRKLATRPGVGALIETRGQGGLAVCCPTPGYTIVQGSFEDVPTLSEDEWNSLVYAARLLDETPVAEASTPAPAKPSTPLAEGELMAGDHYNRDAAWEEVLEPHGWTRVGRWGSFTLWRRPGKSDGWSARTGDGSAGDRLVVFSTSTVLPSMKALTKYAAWAMLEQNTDSPDWGAAALALGRKGFGPQSYRSGSSTATKSVNDRAKGEKGVPADPLAEMGYGKKKKEGWQPGPEEVSDDAPESDPAAAEVLRFSPTEFGNAERLVALYGRDLRYCHLWGKWLVWDGRRFAQDDTGGALVSQLAKAMIRGIARDAWLVENEGRRGEMLEWCGKCHNRSKLENTVALAKTEKGVPVTPDEMDHDYDQVNVLNGVVDLRTSEIREHDRGLLMTKLIDIPFNPDADCPRFIEFLDQVLGGDKDLLRYVWKALGYSLTGYSSEQKLFFCYGNGRNGKSTLIELVMRIMGDYAAAAPPDILMVRNQESAVSNDIAMLKGARMVATDETEDGKRLNEALIKRLTGSQRITARYLHQEFFTFDPTFTIWMSGNHKPQIRGTDVGIWRRVVLIPFNVTIAEEDVDRELPAKLWSEREGILAWLIDGARAWFEEGLGQVETIDSAVASYREESDTLGAFLTECTYIDSEAKVLSSAMYDRYTKWAKQNNEYVMSQKRFSQAMAERGEQKARETAGVYFYGRDLVAATSEQSAWWGDNHD